MILMTEQQRIIAQKRLEEAYEARHSMALGGAVRVVVDQNGERIEYGPTNMLALNKYILMLENQLGLGGPAAPLETWA